MVRVGTAWACVAGERRRAGALLACAAALVCAPGAWAQALHLSTARHVQTQIGGGSVARGESEGAGTFDRRVESSDPSRGASSWAQQVSDVGAFGVTAGGSVGASWTSEPRPLFDARTLVGTTFRWDGAPTPWSLSVDLAKDGQGLGTFTVQLARLSPSAEMLVNYEDVGWRNGARTFSGVLTPGEYRFEVSGVLGAIPSSGTLSTSGTYDVRLLLPSPGAAALAMVCAARRPRRSRS
jgi:hypothetical protein